MRTIVIDRAQDGKRLDRVIRDSFRQMPQSALYKAFRKRDIKVNGIRVKEDHVVNEGDRVDIYIIDDILEGTPIDTGSLTHGFTIVYEDANLLIVNKNQGIPVHPDREQRTNTLIDLVQRYLVEKGEYIPDAPGSFPPSLCHRLDRNTGGLLIIAKNNWSLEILLEKIKNKEIHKYYQCLVMGCMEQKQAELRAFLEKDEYKSRVFVKDTGSNGALEIITRYRMLEYSDDVSRLEVELVTGRTHQIRAHLAYIGHPVVGDGKYGSNTFNRSKNAKYQMLWAYKLAFDFQTSAGALSYLKGRTFQVDPEFI